MSANDQGAKLPPIDEHENEDSWGQRAPDFARWNGRLIQAGQDEQPDADGGIMTTGIRQRHRQLEDGDSKVQKTSNRSSKTMKAEKKVDGDHQRQKSQKSYLTLKPLIFQSIIALLVVLIVATTAGRAIVRAATEALEPWTCPPPPKARHAHPAGGDEESQLQYITSAILPSLDADGLRCRMAFLLAQLQDVRAVFSDHNKLALPTDWNVAEMVMLLGSLHDLGLQAAGNMSILRRQRDALDARRAYSYAMALGQNTGYLLGSDAGGVSLGSGIFSYLVQIIASWLLGPMDCRSAGHKYLLSVEGDTYQAFANADDVTTTIAGASVDVIKQLDKRIWGFCGSLKLDEGSSSVAGLYLKQQKVQNQDHREDGKQGVPLEDDGMATYNDAFAAYFNLCHDIRSALRSCETAFGVASEVVSGPGKQPRPRELREGDAQDEVWMWCVKNSAGGAVRLLGDLQHGLVDRSSRNKVKVGY